MVVSQRVVFDDLWIHNSIVFVNRTSSFFGFKFITY
ncbi:hypothetical protein YSA_09400 [Pseudomonas putida ND6]|uniref:Uncharacterized protein n=1 Tax=Pseudomonas putida ND6 TaxID=231023 RepID=I3V286_PSEPU|nr:hypothetical protein YSA_09400 [Pseudomonas putida ND6]